jgi:hypothetical protein
MSGVSRITDRENAIPHMRGIVNDKGGRASSRALESVQAVRRFEGFEAQNTLGFANHGSRGRGPSLIWDECTRAHSYRFQRNAGRKLPLAPGCIFTHRHFKDLP